MAFVGAGRMDEARQLVARSTDVVQRPTMTSDSNRWMTESVGLPACRAVIAFSERTRYAQMLREVVDQSGAPMAEQQATLWRERFAAV